MSSVTAIGSIKKAIPANLHPEADYKGSTAAPAAVAQWIERQPTNQKVAGSISSQGTCLGCGLIFLPLSFSLPSTLSKNKYRKSFFKKKGSTAFRKDSLGGYVLQVVPQVMDLKPGTAEAVLRIPARG